MLTVAALVGCGAERTPAAKPEKASAGETAEVPTPAPLLEERRGRGPLVMYLCIDCENPDRVSIGPEVIDLDEFRNGWGMLRHRGGTDQAPEEMWGLGFARRTRPDRVEVSATMNIRGEKHEVVGELRLVKGAATVLFLPDRAKPRFIFVFSVPPDPMKPPPD